MLKIEPGGLTPLAFTWTVMITQGASLLLSYFGYWLPHTILSWVLAKTLFPFKKNETFSLMMVMYILNTIGTLLNIGDCLLFMSPCIVYLYYWDHDITWLSTSYTDTVLKWTSEWANSVSVPIIQPILGVNSEMDGLLNIPYNFVVSAFDISFEGITQITTVAEYLRPLEVSQNYLEIEARPIIPAKKVLSRYNSILNSARQLIFGAMALLSLHFLGGVGLASVVALYAVLLTETPVKPTIDKKNAGGTFRDGIYMIKRNWCNFNIEHGIGTALEGVIHIPYHVCRGQPIIYGKGRFKPYYISVDEDIVTYGGPPKLSKIEPGDEVFVKRETAESSTTYRVPYDYDGETNIITWSGVSEPGESGSPILVQRDGVIKLVGLSGRYIKEETSTTEFSNVQKVYDYTSRIEQIITHPGSGKTFRIIPDRVIRFAMANPGKRVLVTGPTRIVCRELYEALRKKISCGLNIKGSNSLRNEFAIVQIAAHKTAMTMLFNNERSVRNLGMIVLDEAHFNDPSTKLLREFGRTEVEKGLVLVELSATLDGKYDDDSNHEIEDIQIKQNEIVQTAKNELEAGKKVLVFVPSVKSARTQQLRKDLLKYKPVLLSRETYEKNYHLVNEENTRLILSTDIAECGINIDELDVVIDTTKKFGYYLVGNSVVGKEKVITQASRVQRRGRVGRKQSGKYYYVEAPVQDNEETSAEFDARVLGSGRDWAIMDNEWGVQMSKSQFQIWLKEDMTPLEIIIRYDIQGIEKPQYLIEKTKRMMRGRGEFYIGCKEKCGKCEGKWEMYDERNHDFLLQ